MENYVLYDEVGRGEHSVVYKGRKKGSIEFVAIHCVEKCKRFELQNIVRLTHELEYPNIVKFHEWYETTNHIWMVFELCTGDSLGVILSQDSGLPEQTVKQFGTDVAKAMYFIHSLGILYCDLQPSKILLDGPGNVKLSDFAIARIDGEDDDIFDFEEQDLDEEGNEQEKQKRPKASPYYMAPEVLMGAAHSKSSDLWSLGCLLYELYTGQHPFTADSFDELAEKILGEDYSDVQQKTEQGIMDASPELSDLIKGLLRKDPPQRIHWPAVARHPFWENALDGIFEEGNIDHTEDKKADVLILEEEKDDTTQLHSNIVTAPRQNAFENQKDIEEHINLDIPEEKGIRQGTYTYSSKPQSPFTELHEGQEEKVKQQTNQHVPIARKKSKELATKTVASKTKSENQVSSRQTNEKGSTSTNMRPAKVTNNKEKSINSPSDSHMNSTENLNKSDVTDLIFHPSDFIVSPIIDNPKIKKIHMPKFDVKALPCQPLKASEIMDLPSEKISEHLKAIQSLLLQTEKDGGHMASLQRSKLHTASYLASISRSGDVANLVFESADMVSNLVQLVKSGFSAEFKGKIGYILGLLAGNATIISEDFYMTEIFTTLTEVIRDNFRNTRLKQHLLPALGEFLFYAATQEESEGTQIAKWDVPGVTFTIITRCLNEGEDIDVQHCAAKTIELVATTHGRHSDRLVTNDTAQLLWKLFTHCTVDVQKVTAISALCRLTCHSPSVFQHVVEKAGFKAVIGTFSSTVPRVQQSLTTMFAALLTGRPQAKRVIKEKDFINKIMHLFESPSVVIRSKAFLVVLGMMQLSREALLGCCQARLVMYIEKDQRRATPIKGQSPDNHVYLQKCLQKCMTAIIEAAPDVLWNVVSILEVVSGRRHPSANQTKELRTHLPLLSIILHLVTSHVFRSHVVNQSFLHHVGSLLVHIKSIEEGSTSIGSAAGPSAAEDLTYVVLSIVECITQHPPLLLDHHTMVVDAILPSLAALVSSSNGNTRMLCFRMFSDVASLYLDNDNVYSSSSAEDSVVASTRRINEVISQHLLPQYHMILQDQDPLPSYGLKLLASCLEKSPQIIQTFLDQGLLMDVTQIVSSHAGEGNLSMMQSIVGLLDCVLASTGLDMAALYQQGLIDSVTSLFIDIAAIMNGGGGEPSDMSGVVLPLLDTVNNILKYVSKEVRQALQAKNEGKPDSSELTHVAEALLMDSKPLADLTGILINFLCHEDADIQEWACKSLYLVAELFGGVYEDAMNGDNMECFAVALQNSNDKRCKQLLRILKRIVSSNPNHVASIANNGQALVESLVKLKTPTSRSGPDAEAVQTLARDILTKIGVS